MLPTRLLANPVIWEAARISLDCCFGLYRYRIKKIADWGLLKGEFSILDIGCGIGHYSQMPSTGYLGIDCDQRYIDYAQKKNRNPRVDFRCVDTSALLREGSRFDIVLMVDFLHHLSDADAAKVLVDASRLARTFIVNFEPIKEQTNAVGQWLIDHDRGDFIRPMAELQGLLMSAPLTVTESVAMRLGPILSRATLARPAPR